MRDSLIDLAGLQVGAEDFLLAVLETTAQPMWVVDREGLIRFANPAAIAALGYDRADELYNRHSHETIHHSRPDGTPYEPAECPLLRAITSGETVASEHDWFFRRDGSMFPVSYVSVPLDLHDGRGAVVAFTDIADRLRAERAARERDEHLAARQASLHRVARIVSSGAASAEVFSAIAREVASVLELPAVWIGRYEANVAVTIVGSWNDPAGPGPPARWQLEGPGVATEVRKTGRPAMVDDYAMLGGPLADAARRHGIRAGAAAPIIIDANVWGVMGTWALDGDVMAEDLPDRLADFATLMTGVVGDIASRDEAVRLGDAQAGLRRVATLAARQSPPAEIFHAVAEEIARVLGTGAIGMLRFDSDGTAALIAQSPTPWEPPPLGTRFPLVGDDVVAAVHRTGAAARRDEWEHATGPVADAARDLGIRSTVAAPIVVAGRLWGTMVAASAAAEPLPPHTESRLAEFTELLATAIANAEVRSQLSRLAEEQAALRRVATLVAQEAPATELFAKVAEEVSTLLGPDLDAAILRFDRDESATVVAVWGQQPQGGIQMGAHLPVDGSGVTARVFSERRPVRVDDYLAADGVIADRAHRHGILSAIGCPIMVQDRLWGAMVVAHYRPQPFAADTERRLGQFTELVATALANAQARAEVRRLAEEQAALRRVATLVAEGAAPARVFDAVIVEVAQLLGAAQVGLMRRESADAITILAHRGQDHELVHAGMRLSLEGDSATARVLRTGRSARLNAYDLDGGSIAGIAHRSGVSVTVGAPIVVDGALWGVITASWTGQDLPPDHPEERLAQFAELVDTAIANAAGRDQLMASRARVLTAGDDARRRLVRDLHDGAQQRLIHTIVALGLARRALRHDVERAEALLAQALDHAERGNVELRELAHGILPAVLTRGGLHAAVDSLAARLDLPVDVDMPSRRMPAEVEASAYFVVAEALTNVTKHAHATHAAVTATLTDDAYTIEVRDDGAGGADPEGHGLLGMGDRVAALGGRLRIDSPPGGGTVVTAELPRSR
jgi:PAS domain S-box-containing protein